MFDSCVKDKAELKFVGTNQNTEKLEQFTGIKNTFVSAIRDIDSRYGIFNGPMFLYCDLDKQVCMWDLSKVVDREALYTVHFLTLGENEDDIINAGGKDNVFYTYDTLMVNNKSNTDAMTNAYNHKILIKPKNKFFSTMDIDLGKISKENAVSDGDDDFNELLKKRTRFHNDYLVSDSEKTSASVIKAKLSKNITASLGIKFNLTGNLKISRLSKVGQAIELNPHYVGYRDYQGKYIVGTSLILISRQYSEFYTCTAHISCFRSNVEG